ncbi:CST complex subunit Ten1 [Xylaria cf. heliscus]|nr:CST complex subunit Ten1 [Xylaria cf. heliscus]
MSNGPLPSERCLLSSLCNRQIGDKVRFLGCVTGYSTYHAHVTLKHNYPKQGNEVEALVDVKLLLKTLKSEQTDTGQWVHVIGYLTFVDPASAATATDSRHPSRSQTIARVGVQALFLWVARGLDLGTYEKSMLANANQNAVSLAPKNRDAR